MVRLYQGVLALMPPKALPLFPVAAGVRVQNFAEPVRSTVIEIRRWRSPVAARSSSSFSEGNQSMYDRTDPGEHQNAGSSRDEGEHRHLDFFLLDLLSQVFRRAPHHQPGNEHRENGVEQNAVETRADAAEDDFAGHGC